MDTASDFINRLFQAKQERRQALARASFADKIKMLVKLQEIAARVLLARGIAVRPWRVF